MDLLPREKDKLILATAGTLAQRRLARGLRLNKPEVVALIAYQLHELMRDGKHSVAELMDLGKKMLGRRHVMDGVPERIHMLQVEGTFHDGSFLVTVHDPVCSDDGDLSLALYGSFLPVPSNDLFPVPKQLKPEELLGAVVCRKEKIKLNEGRRRILLEVKNEGDRPVQVGSHYPFLETNPALVFDRVLSYGMHIDSPAGHATRFEPGERKTIALVEYGGNKILSGGSAIATGQVREANRDSVLQRVKDLGFGHKKQEVVKDAPVYEMDRDVYASVFGPTVGDKMRLADTPLWIEVEKDYTTYGDESKFGSGKVIRDGMGQASNRKDEECLDLVITNCVIVDWAGIIKADIGVKNGKIAGVGKAGNPDVQDGVSPNMIIGSVTEVLAGEGLIITAGAIDTHVHFICPQTAEEALASGITTVVGGGTGPADGTNATTCTTSKWYMEAMMLATDGHPINYGFSCKGNDSGETALAEMVEAGASSLKVHEDWGSTPEVIDRALNVAERYDVQVNIHTDTQNESGFVENTVEAFKGRTIHTYHTEGAGGGHAPDIIVVCEHPNVLPSSTNPTRPYAVNTLDEHMDMLMVCHHLDRSIPEDIAFADSRIRGETVAAEDVLQDIGAISMVSSDTLAMGRIGEVITRTWRTASKLREMRGPLSQDKDSGNDNFRVKRYIAKITVNPAITHGMSHMVGSVAPGLLADLVLWDPADFGVRPKIVVKGGFIAWAQMGDANASIPTVQPVFGRRMYGAEPEAASLNSVVFVSQASLDNGTIGRYGLRKRAVAVKNCRKIGKKDMKLNDALPVMEVDPETYEVFADGEHVDIKPADHVALAFGNYLY